MKLADNLDRADIKSLTSMNSPDRTIDFGSYLPFTTENHNIRHCPEHSLFNFDLIFINRTGIKF